jgi:nucleoside-diphosphate-sugar epimerase
MAEADIPRTVLVTGATGFVGTGVIDRIRRATDLRLRAAARRKAPLIGEQEYAKIGDLRGSTDWSAALGGVDTVVHLAARVHIMRDTATDPLRAFRELNVNATENLARQAASAGARRFVYLSSIKVNGEQTAPGRPFTASDAPAPLDPYGQSKHEAEEALRAVTRETGMEHVIIRPPIVYGPGVKANFLSMMRWLHRGIPLPFGALHNQRSLVGLDNLADLILTCVRHPGARNQVFLAADGEDLSTTALLRRLSCALGRSARLIPVPEAVLRAALAALGKPDLARRLCGSLQVDIGATRHTLGWTPPLNVDEGLKKVALSFLAHTQGTS